MSVRTFSRRFRDETGITPGQWLTQQRTEHARRLLASEQQPPSVSTCGPPRPACPLPPTATPSAPETTCRWTDDVRRLPGAAGSRSVLWNKQPRRRSLGPGPLASTT
jgi:AraC-like DNA-binding protein